MRLLKIVTGGQTGVDRGALEAALNCGFPCGGWCPPGRAAEDGPIPDRYPLQEMTSGSYQERTIQNVRASDGTAILHFGEIRGGTEETLRQCRRLGKPCIPIDGAQTESRQAAELIAAFVEQYRIAILNVAGPRQSEAPEGYTYACAAISGLLAESAPGFLRGLRSGDPQMIPWNGCGKQVALGDYTNSKN